MKVLIVSAWKDRYEGDQRSRKFPALSAVHLAALCPPHVEVKVWHELIRPLDLSRVDADLVAITSTTGSSSRMYEIADLLRKQGLTVILGGPHVSLVPDEAILHADGVAVGDAEYTFPQILRDFEHSCLNRIYRQPENLPLSDLPIPRYDLFENEFVFRCFVQATRGCPYHCTFCTLKSLDRHFRVRPVEEVVRDIAACDGRNWLQRKFLWFWDDNLTGSPDYARELFRKFRPLRKWWWAQCSIDAAQDPDLLRLAANSGCLAVFIGIETFSADNLLQIRKRQNRVDRYRKAIQAFHNVGIAVHAGIIVGLDSDTEENIRIIPEIVESLGIDLPFLNVLTPFPGTPLHGQIRDGGRLLSFEWEHYNGADVTFFPRGMTPQVLENAYWDVHHQFYSIRCTVRRIWNTAWFTRLPSLLLNASANAFFGIQNLISPDRPYPLEKKKSLSYLTYNCADQFADDPLPSAKPFTPNFLF